MNNDKVAFSLSLNYWEKKRQSRTWTNTYRSATYNTFSKMCLAAKWMQWQLLLLFTTVAIAFVKYQKNAAVIHWIASIACQRSSFLWTIALTGWPTIAHVMFNIKEAKIVQLVNEITLEFALKSLNFYLPQKILLLYSHVANHTAFQAHMVVSNAKYQQTNYSS